MQSPRPISHQSRKIGDFLTLQKLQDNINETFKSLPLSRSNIGDLFRFGSETSIYSESNNGFFIRSRFLKAPETKPRTQNTPESAIKTEYRELDTTDTNETTSVAQLHVLTRSNLSFYNTKNKISTCKYTLVNFLFKFFLEQFKSLSNVWFAFVSVMQQIPGISPTGRWTTLGPLILIFIIAAIREIFQDFRRYLDDKKINNKSVLVREESGKWVKVLWKNVVPGQFLLVLKNQLLPADMILLGSTETNNICHIETSNLDGETNLKLRQANNEMALKLITTRVSSAKSVVRKASVLPDESPSMAEVRKNMDKEMKNPSLDIKDDMTALALEAEVERPNKQLYDFKGNMKLNFSRLPNSRRSSIPSTIPLNHEHLLLRGSQLRNTKAVIGMAIYTGKNSKLMKNSRSAPIKVSKIVKKTNTFTLYLFIIMLAMAIISTFGAIFDLDVAKSHPYIASLMSNKEEMDVMDSIKNMTKISTTAVKYIVGQLLTYIILYNAIVPISLMVTLEIVKVCLATFVNNDLDMYDKSTGTMARARTSNIMEEIGQVKYIFSDKTGTLTRNIMEYKAAFVRTVCTKINNRLFLKKTNGAAPCSRFL